MFTSLQSHLNLHIIIVCIHEARPGSILLAVVVSMCD